MTGPLVSIIIVNFNGGEMLTRCLKSIFETEYRNFEIILVDNASNDGSTELCERLFGGGHNFKVVRLDKNLGFAEGNNIGIRYCRGKYIVFLNNDVVVEPKWLSSLIQVMESDREIAIAQSKLLQLQNPKFFDSAGDFIDSFGNTFRRGWGEKDYGQYDQIEEVFSARGAAMMIRAEVIKEVGAFDGFLFGSYEDIDLCWRVRRAGYKVVYVPSSVVYHAGGATTKKLNLKFRVLREAKNLLIVSLKNKNLVELIRYCPLIPIIGAMFIDIVRRRTPILFMARFKAILQVLVELRIIWQKRFCVPAQTRNIDLILRSSFTDMTRFFVNSLRFGPAIASKTYFSSLMNKQKLRYSR